MRITLTYVELVRMLRDYGEHQVRAAGLKGTQEPRVNSVFIRGRFDDKTMTAVIDAEAIEPRPVAARAPPRKR